MSDAIPYSSARTAARPTGNRRSIPILTYHQIAEVPAKGAPFRSLYVAPAAFARQMALLKALGYSGLSMTALLPYLRGERTGKVVGITFDDGYLNNLQHALPALQRQGFSSTCYAVSGLLGRTNAWDAVNGIAQTPLMDADQLRQWVAGGQEIGSHTAHHVNLADSDDALSQAEIAGGGTALEAAIGQPVRHFCYPYGRYEARHTAMAGASGFDTATTTERGRVRAGDDLLELPRVPVLRSTTLPVFWAKIATGYEDRRRR